MALIRFIIKLFTDNDEEPDPPERKPECDKVATLAKKLKIPLWTL